MAAKWLVSYLVLAGTEALIELISSRAGPCDESVITELDMRLD